MCACVRKTDEAEHHWEDDAAELRKGSDEHARLQGGARDLAEGTDHTEQPQQSEQAQRAQRGDARAERLDARLEGHRGVAKHDDNQVEAVPRVRPEDLDREAGRFHDDLDGEEDDEDEVDNLEVGAPARWGVAKLNRGKELWRVASGKWHARLRVQV